MMSEDIYKFLIKALSDDNINRVYELISNIVNVNEKFDNGQTVLMGAAAAGHTNVVKILLDKGADINIKDKYGHTAIIIAAKKGHTDIVKLLLDNGADETSLNKIKTEKKRILVVDNDENATTGLCKLLSKSGYKTIGAESGEKALEYFQNDYFDLIITDVRMTGMTGIDVLKKTKEISPNTRVIVYTAYADTDLFLEATENGVFAFLAKPISVDKIKEIVAKAIPRKYN